MGAPSEPDPARDLADAALEAARALGPELLPEDLEVEVRPAPAAFSSRCSSPASGRW